MEKLVLMDGAALPLPGEDPAPGLGWPDESWREYAEWSLLHDDYLHNQKPARTALAPEREQLAWAAGFYDGEGSCSAFIRPEVHSGDYVALCMSIGQNSRQPLDRFQASVGGLGGVYGPRMAGNLSTNPRYDWQSKKFEVVQAVAAMLWPFLCEPKRVQIAASLTAWHKSWQARTERRHFCLRGHDKRVTGRVGSGGGCRECCRLGYWRTRPAVKAERLHA